MRESCPGQIPQLLAQVSHPRHTHQELKCGKAAVAPDLVQPPDIQSQQKNTDKNLRECSLVLYFLAHFDQITALNLL